MQVPTILRQLVNHVGVIMLSIPQIHPKFSYHPFPSLTRQSVLWSELVGKWKAYLKWEEGNPLEIEEKDWSILITRIQGVYRKTVIEVRLRYSVYFS
jgi:cleavage stimulation factor subunit 3